MKKKRKTETPQRRSYVETPLLTGQYPAFGIESGKGAEEQDEKKNERS